MGKLANADFQTLAQITGAGGTAADLLNDTKMYSSVLGAQMSAAFTAGSIANLSVPTLMAEFATPAAPPALQHKLYFKADGNLYMLNSASVETQVNGGGSGFPTTDAIYLVTDNVTPTKTQVWQLAGQAAATSLTLASSNTVNSIITFPDFAADTLAVLSGIQTITNKVFPAEGVGANTINGMAASNLVYSDTAGKLSSLPSWTTDLTAGISAVTSYQILPMTAPAANQKIVTFEAELDAVVASSALAVQGLFVDFHLDRSGSGGDFTAGQTALSISATAEQAGTAANITALNINNSAGVGNPGTTTQMYGVSLGQSVGAGHTLNNATGLNTSMTVNATGALTDYNGYVLGVNGDLTGNLVGYSLNRSAGNTVGGTVTGYNSYVGGSITGNYQGLNIIQDGNSANYLGLNLVQQSGNTGNNTGAIIQFSNGTSTGKTGLSMLMGTGATAGSGRFLELGASTSSYTNFIGINLNNQGIVTTAGGYTGLNIGATGGASVDSHTGINSNWAGTVTGNYMGAYFGAQAGTTVGAGNTATGVSVDFTNITTTTQKLGLYTQQGSIFADALYDNSIYAQDPGFFQLNSLGGTFNIGSGFPVVNSGGILTNLGCNLNIADSIGVDPFGGFLGISVAGFLGQLNISVGQTVDTLNAMIAAISVTAGAGTITNGNSYVAGGFVNGGATTTVTNQTGFLMINGASSMATNAWGVKILDTAATNSFAKNVVVGDTVASNASVGIELDATDRAILFSRMTTAQRTALTAVDGMQVYDTDDDTMYAYINGAWTAWGTGGGAANTEELWLNGSTGFAGTNTNVRIYQTVERDTTGVFLTYVPDGGSGNGDSIVVNNNCRVEIMMMEASSNVIQQGYFAPNISGTQLSTDPSAATRANQAWIGSYNGAVAGYGTAVTSTYYATAGTVIWPTATNAGFNSNAADSIQFRIAVIN